MDETLKDIVSWTMQDEKILKLEKSGKTCDIDEKVFKFMEAKGLLDKEDYEVEVDIESKGDNDGTIVKLVPLNDKNETKTETKSEEKKEEKEEKSDLENKTLTVAGVSVKNNGVTFKEEDKVWYTLDSSIDATTFKNECTKKLVSVDIEKTEKGNDLIKSYKIIETEETPKESTTKNSFESSTYNSTTQASIEAQVSLEHAQKLAGVIFGDVALDRLEDLNKFISYRAKENYKLMQELKSGK